MISLSGDCSLRITLARRGSNLENHLRWMEYLAGPEFLQGWKSRFESAGNLQRLRQSARQVFQELVYDKYDPASYRRTYAALDSFRAVGEEGSPNPGATVASDPAVATAIAGNAAGSFSYAAFFEKPIQFDSFIKSQPGDDLNVIRYRPFFDVMSAEHNRVSTDIHRQSFLKQVKQKMPKQS